MSTKISKLKTALHAGEFNEAIDLLGGDICLDDLIDEDGSSLLHRASQDGDKQMVRFFMVMGCPLSIESFDYVSHTPLIWAAEYGHLQIVKKLLDAGANPNANEVAKIGNTAIREAVRNGHADVVRCLLDAGADPTIEGWMQISAVDQAWHEVEQNPHNQKELQRMFAKYPSKLRDKRGV